MNPGPAMSAATWRGVCLIAGASCMAAGEAKSPIWRFLGRSTRVVAGGDLRVRRKGATGGGQSGGQFGFEVGEHKSLEL